MSQPGRIIYGRDPMISGYTDEEDYTDPWPMETNIPLDMEGVWHSDTTITTDSPGLENEAFMPYPVTESEAYQDPSGHFAFDAGGPGMGA
ncbi:hypothetical protein N0V93_001455 [Gnomoniopsis smithogilvyi]|uniref:Uncharacterized protein n=1 Tax=Gnomoniopsis smithogilvyi TaxID=1191159 RepID=A0A9W8Z3J4_9PEZI|nr:hypothetical protein N0V93_001455 [Gnomoniopsis smithogilvyi]